MRLALCADLHFGSVPEGLAGLLGQTMQDQKPDLIIIAGDLTLRARALEFDDAKSWLASLNRPTLILPGNHDLPYVNLLQRFADPFRRYRQASGAETLMPTANTADGFVLGFNTTGSWQPHFRWQEGVARRQDIAAAQRALSEAPSGVFKAVAGHHPFVAISSNKRARPVRRAGLALAVFAEAGVRLLMSGHTHLSFAMPVEVSGKTMIAVGAPTALSSRMRGEANGFWIIDTGGHIRCELWLRDAAGDFMPAGEKVFESR